MRRPIANRRTEAAATIGDKLVRMPSQSSKFKGRVLASARKNAKITSSRAANMARRNPDNR